MLKFSSNYQVLSFDLDDALYDNRPIIKAAEKISSHYLKQVFLEQEITFDYEKLFHIRSQLQNQKNHCYENLSFLRKQVLFNFCQDLNEPEKTVNHAFNLFIQARNQVVVEPAIINLLTLLSTHFTLVSVSNGNCNIQKTALSPFFKASYSPTQNFRAKPHPQMLQQVMHDFSISTQQILHIGDSLEKDGKAAQYAEIDFFHFAPFQNESLIDIDCQKLIGFLNQC